MNPVYSPAPTGVPFTNSKGLGYPGRFVHKMQKILTLCNYFMLLYLLFVMIAGFPVGYAAAAPAYTPNVYQGANPAFSSGKSLSSVFTVFYLLIYIIKNYIHTPMF